MFPRWSADTQADRLSNDDHPKKKKKIEDLNMFYIHRIFHALPKKENIYKSLKNVFPWTVFSCDLKDQNVSVKCFVSWNGLKWRSNHYWFIYKDFLSLPSSKNQFCETFSWYMIDSVVVWFYGISTIVGYLMPNPFLYIYTIIFQTIQFIISIVFCLYSWMSKQFYFKQFSLA